MELQPGQRELYQKRHDEIWPELVDLLKDAGISDYSIFLDEETSTLFAVLRRTEDHKMAILWSSVRRSTAKRVDVSSSRKIL